MPPDSTITSIAGTSLTGAERDEAAIGSQPPEIRRGGSVLMVDFHQDGNSARYRKSGWSGQEATYVWSVRGSSSLWLPAPIEVSALVVELDFTICTGRERPTAAVIRVFANGSLIGAARVTGWTRLRCDIPAELVAPDRPLELRFEHPCFVRMDRIDPGGDDRALGLCFYAVRLLPPWLAPMMDRALPRPPDGKLIHAKIPSAPLLPEVVDPVLYRFAASEAGHAYLREGWLHDQAGDAWADSRLCTLELPAPSEPGRYLARFTLSPLFIRNFMTSQRINIMLAGAVIGQFNIRTETSLAIPLPPELYDGIDVLRFSFAMPGGLPMHQFYPAQPPNFLSFLLDQIEIAPIPPELAAGPAAVRDDDVTVPLPIAVSERFLDEPVDALPDAVKLALGVDLAEILRQFESLGDNCAFGLAQRKAGCEVLGLLRFANTPLRALLTALDDQFHAAGAKDEVALRLHDSDAGEYSLHVDRYGIRWHTNVFAGDVDEATVFDQQTMRLSYLRRKFYEGLRAGRKILTISRAEPRKHPIPLPYLDEPAVWEEKPECLRLAEVLPLFLRLNHYGRNTVLYLTRCAHNRRSGTVELLAPGLLRGYLDDFVITPDVDNPDHAAWLRVAVNAWLLDQGPNASFRSTTVS